MRIVKRGGAGVVLGALLALGCSSASRPGGGDDTGPTPADDLFEVAGLIRDYTAEHHRGPTKLADFTKNQPLYPRGYQAVKAGTVVVVWGARLPAEGGGPGVVAYEKKAETEGGSVLLENGTIKPMTAAEFAAAPKAR